MLWSRKLLLLLLRRLWLLLHFAVFFSIYLIISCLWVKYILFFLASLSSLAAHLWFFLCRRHRRRLLWPRPASIYSVPNDSVHKSLIFRWRLTIYLRTIRSTHLPGWVRWKHIIWWVTWQCVYAFTSGVHRAYTWMRKHQNTRTATVDLTRCFIPFFFLLL